MIEFKTNLKEVYEKNNCVYNLQLEIYKSNKHSITLKAILVSNDIIECEVNGKDIIFTFTPYFGIEGSDTELPFPEGEFHRSVTKITTTDSRGVAICKYTIPRLIYNKYIKNSYDSTLKLRYKFQAGMKYI